MISAFSFGNFRLIGKAKDIPAMIAAVAASRGAYNQWSEYQKQKAHSQDIQITSRREQAHVPANSEDSS